jgi:hypothetical protein
MRLSTNRYRIIYFLDTGKTFILLHGFVKKTEKMSKFDLEIARNGSYLLSLTMIKKIADVLNAEVELRLKPIIKVGHSFLVADK